MYLPLHINVNDILFLNISLIKIFKFRLIYKLIKSVDFMKLFALFFKYSNIHKFYYLLMSSENFISFKLLTKYTLANFSYKHFIKDNKLQMEK